MKLKECMLYTGIVVCLAAGTFYFIFREEPLYRYAKKIELLKNDNILIEDVKDLPESIPLEKSVFVHCNTVGE